MIVKSNMIWLIINSINVYAYRIHYLVARNLEIEKTICIGIKSVYYPALFFQYAFRSLKRN